MENNESANEQMLVQNNNIDENNIINKSDIEPLVNGTTNTKSQYRLVIHVDKIRTKPGPKSRKLLQLRKIRNKLLENVPAIKDILLEEENNSNSIPDSDNSNDKNLNSLPTKKPRVLDIDDTIDLSVDNQVHNQLNHVSEDTINSNTTTIPCAKGCQLETRFYNKKHIVCCTRCNKAYMQKKKSQEKKHRCLICKCVFETPERLTEHIKEHSTCGICGIECHTKENLQNHVTQHIGRPPHFPFKCHLCTEVFRKEEHVRSHLTNKHFIAKNVGKQIESIVNLDPQLQNVIAQALIEVQNPLKFEVHRCIPCNITFRNEAAFQRHARSHKSKESLYPSQYDQITKDTNTMISQSFGQLCPVKFTCRVCSQDLASFAEIDAHTKSHMDSKTQPSFICKMCDQTFTSNEALNEHVQEHLLKAHRCPICAKAFINTSTLKIHFKTHTNTIS